MERIKNKFEKIKNDMKLKKSVAYVIFSNPQIYVGRLLKRTLYIGLTTLVLSWIYIHTDLHELKIPSALHSLIGIVIGLLLVFRTNTAYDRWWEGRKCIASISNNMSFFIIKLRSLEFREEKLKHLEEKITKKFVLFLNDMKNYLVTDDSKNLNSLPFHKKQMFTIQKIMGRLLDAKSKGLLTEKDASILEGYLFNIMEQSNACERIKNTPIPLAFMLHIKTSIFIYLLTLPFGLFSDLGMWSTLMVMLIFYIVAGIEIISTEIENPFAGDPNDLPVEELLNSIKESISESEKTKS